MKRQELAKIFDLNCLSKPLKNEQLNEIVEGFTYDYIVLNYNSLSNVFSNNKKIKCAGMIDFASGEMNIDTKLKMVKDYINVGASKIYVSLNHYYLQNYDNEYLLEEISRLKAYSSRCEIVPLIDIDLLSKNDLARALRLLGRLNIQKILIKSSKDYLLYDDIALIKMIVGPKMKLEAMLNVYEFADVCKYVKAGISHFVLDNPVDVMMDFIFNYES